MGRFVGEPLLFPSDERRVIARPRGDAAAIDFDDPRREALQKRAIVRHEHHRARVVGQKPFQPRDGVEVQVVGRLVEQQQIRLRDERPREQHAAAPAARQGVDTRLRRQVQPRQDQLHSLLDAPPVTLFQLVLQLSELREHRGRASLGDVARRVVIGGDELADIAEAVGDHVEHRAVCGQRNVLREPADAQARLKRYRTGVDRPLAAQNLKNRRLAAAVPADQRHAFARLDLQHDIVEQRQMSEGERDMVERGNRHLRAKQDRQEAYHAFDRRPPRARCG